jgi:MFS family permease
MFHYFKGNLSPGFISIYTARMTLRISGALLGLFMPIFLYSLFDFELKFVIYYYLIGHLAYFLLVAYGASYLNRIGLRRSFRISIILGALYFVTFYFLEQQSHVTNFGFGNNPIFILLVWNIIIITLHRIMYWIPLHTDLAKFTDKGNRAKQLSAIEATTLALGAVGPVVAGWVLINYSYDVLFIIAVLVYLIALIPLIALPRTKERFSWSYTETWKEFLSKKRRKTVFAFMGDGAEGVVGVIIWPLFIYELLEGNLFEIGALSSLIVFVTIFLQLGVGGFTDKHDKKKMLHWGSAFYAIGWIVKIFIVTAFHIFIASAFHNLTKIFARTPFDAMSYDRAADQGHYVDEYTVIHEMAVQLGKVISLAFVLLLIPFFEIQWIFVIAALASITMNYLADDDLIEKGRHAG